MKEVYQNILQNRRGVVFTIENFDKPIRGKIMKIDYGRYLPITVKILDKLNKTERRSKEVPVWGAGPEDDPNLEYYDVAVPLRELQITPQQITSFFEHIEEVDSCYEWSKQ